MNNLHKDKLKVVTEDNLLIEAIREVATRKCWEDDDDFCVDGRDYADDNVLDAYSGGRDTGEVALAGYLLRLVDEG